MIKSELIEHIAPQNPHLYQRDIEKIVSTILDEITRLWKRTGEARCGFEDDRRP